jgi:ABC-type hemin transport system substrate-binding protein
MNNGNMVGAPDDIFSLPAFAATPAAHRALITMDGDFIFSASACARPTPCAN